MSIDVSLLRERLEDAEGKLLEACDEINTLQSRLKDLETLSDARDKAFDSMERVHDELGGAYKTALDKIKVLEAALLDTDAAALLLKEMPRALKLHTQETDDLKRRVKELEKGWDLDKRLYTQEVDDLNVQRKFWRQAAEHAVTGWNKLEDTVEEARDKLSAIESSVEDVRLLLGSSDEWAPPEHVLQPVDRSEPGMCSFRVIETETSITVRPRKLSCGHTTDDHPNARNYLEGAAEREGPVCSLGWAKD